jgi:ribose transport system substrate-binding protein
MKKYLAFILVFAMVLSLTACGTEANAPASNAPASSAPAADPASPAPAQTPKKIAMIVKVIGNQYWAVLQAGAEQAGKDLGCEVIVTGVGAESDIEGQITLLQNAVSAKVDAIVIGPVDSTSLAAPVKEAYESGIPVVLVDTVVNGEDYSAALLTDNVEAGRMAAEEMLKKLRETGLSEDKESVIAVQVGAAGSQTIIDRLKGFNEYWDANAPKAWKVLNDDIKVNEGSIEKATSFGQDFLTAYPNLVGMFGPNNGSTVGFVTSLTEAGRKDIVMIGFDFSDEIANMIKSGEYICSSVVQRQYYMGYDGVKLALDLANGGSVTEKSIDTGVMLVDASNVNTAEVQSVINP